MAPTGSEMKSNRKAGVVLMSTAIDVKKAVVGLATPTVIEQGLKILDQLTNIGQTVPFVAPAFVILGVLLDIEAKAREADAKCTDLLERINFMMGHLSVLERVKVMDATRRVIDNMIEVLKSATTLVQAYRKHGAIARRLNVGYRDKFASCAAAVTSCCNDLMMSLQIHQTSQLDILTRAVPTDPEDEAAQTFLAKHGGADAVKGDQELVTQFAQELHLTMDDKSMEQINTSLANVMQQNQAQLERALTENVGAAVYDSLKELVAQAKEAEKEQVFKCVQCDKDFRDSTNGPTSCNFHPAEYSSWNKNYPCCSTAHPCQFQSHRAVHHCEYPYGSFFERSRKILNYVDTVEDWASVNDVDLESDNTQKASIGRLLRWVSRGEFLREPTILITVGSVWYSEPYFFETFTSKDLTAAANTTAQTRNATIFRTSPSKTEFSLAEWLVSGGTITGVRLTVKAATSETPFVQVCPINMDTCAKSGDILTLSKGGLRFYKPATPYAVPETVAVGPTLSDELPRPVRIDFKTRTSPKLPVVLKVLSEPPLKANPQFASYTSDTFEGAISVFNKHLPDSSNPITIASVSASFRLVGDQDYAPVTSLKVLDSTLPVTIDPRRSCTLAFQAVVPRSEEDAQHEIRWWNRAFVARSRPLRLKLCLQDIEDEECSIVLEYVFSPFPLEKPKEDDLAFFYFDEPDLWERRCVRVTKSTSENGVANFPSKEIDATCLKRIVYQAIKTGETEVDLGIGGEQSGGAWEWTAWALVDLSCRRVYAFKVLLKQGHRATKRISSCLGYFLCPDYGDSVKKSCPIRYAVEQVKFPELEPFAVQEFAVDDTVDDIIPDPPKPIAGSTQTVPSNTTSSQVILSEDLNQRLASIDSSLLRIATTVERLVDIFAKMKPSEAIDMGL